MHCCVSELRVATVWKVDGQVTWGDDCAFPGQDLDGTPSRNIAKKEDCGKICLANSLCDHFTWNTDKTCWLKNQWTGTASQIYKLGARCGYITGRSWTADGWTVDDDVTWKDNCDLKGQDLQETTSNNPSLKNTIQECGKACFDHTKCDHFTWMSVDKKCNLKIQWDGNSPTDLANAKCGYVDPPLTSWRKQFIAVAPSPDRSTDVVFYWAMACYFSGLYNPTTSSQALSFQSCVTNCANDINCKNLVWTPVKLVFMGNTKVGKCAHYNGTQVSNSIVPRIRKKGNVQGTACGFFEARQLSIQSVIPTDTDDSKYNP